MSCWSSALLALLSLCKFPSVKVLILPRSLPAGAPESDNYLPPWTSLSNVTRPSLTSSSLLLPDCPQLKKWHHCAGKWVHARSLRVAFFPPFLCPSTSISVKTYKLDFQNVSQIHHFLPFPLPRSRPHHPFTWPITHPLVWAPCIHLCH